MTRHHGVVGDTSSTGYDIGGLGHRGSLAVFEPDGREHPLTRNPIGGGGMGEFRQSTCR